MTQTRRGPKIVQCTDGRTLLYCIFEHDKGLGRINRLPLPSSSDRLGSSLGV